MVSSSIPQPSARTFSVVDLVEQVRRGRVRIPEFQRPLRWQWEDVRRLFDSIVRGYPLGSLLFWQRHAPATQVRLGALTIDAQDFADGWWVVDGQQRLTCLANALDEDAARDKRFELAFDLREKTFCRPPQTEDGFKVPVPVLYDLSRLFRWFVEHQEARELLDDASRVTKAIREFSIPAYLVEQQDEAILRDIYDRMNSFGKRLSRAEVFSALHPAHGDRGDPRSSFETIAATIDREKGFGLLDDDTVLRAILARRSPNVSRDIHAEFSEQGGSSREFSESTDDAYREGEGAILRAVEFLQDDAGVPHFTLLPYRYLLVVLARFFAHSPKPQARNRALLRRWFWRAAMHGPDSFNSSWTEAMRVLATCIVAGDESGSVQQLLRALPKRAVSLPSLERFNSKAAESRVVLCALWSLQPRSLVSGKAFTREALGESIALEGSLGPVVGRIVRRAPERYRDWAANRCFLLETELIGGALDWLLSTRLEGQLLQDTLASHALSEALLARLAAREYESFLEGRQQLVRKAMESFLGRMGETDFEDTPPLDSLDFDDDGPRDDT